MTFQYGFTSPSSISYSRSSGSWSSHQAHLVDPWIARNLPDHVPLAFDVSLDNHQDRIFVISDDGIEHVWIFRRNRTTKVDWPSVYRVYLHKRHGRYHSTTYIRVKYDGRTMTVPLYPHTTAILESFIGHIPSQSIDGRVVSFYKRVLKDYGPVP